MNVYLAARFAARPQMRLYAKRLADLDFKVVSRWINSEHPTIMDHPDPHTRMEAALDNTGDLMASHLVIAFDGDANDPVSERGGRHVEFGMAVGFGKTLVYVGKRSHVFHYLPSVFHYETFDKLIADLERARENGHWFPFHRTAWYERHAKKETPPCF